MLLVHNAGELQRAHREYLESRVLAAPPVVLVEMLYQVAITALQTAIGHLQSGDAMARSKEVTRAQDAVSQLMLALDPSAQVSFTPALASLYTYIQEEILKGHAQCSEAAFQNALSVLKPLLEGWSGVCEQVTGRDAAGVSGPEPPALTQAASSHASTAPGSAYQLERDPASRDWNC